MSRSDPVQVGVIGLRGFGEHHLRECRAHPGARLLAVCDSDRALAQAAAAEHAAAAGAFVDYREMLRLPELDAVVIAAPHFLHRPMTMAALRSGKHVLCEKPFTTSGRDAAAAVRLARRKGLVLSCNYNRRLTAPVRALRKLVADGTLGEVYHARASWLACWTGFLFSPETGWRTSRAKAGGGILIGRGCHMADAMLHVLGFPPARRVFATCQNRLTGLEVEDLAGLTVELRGGATVEIQVSYVLHEPELKGGEEIRYAVYGTRAGAAYRSGPEGESFSVGSGDLATGRWRPLDAALPPAPAGPRPLTVMADFLDSIVEGREPLVAGEQAAAVIGLIEAGYRSARTGRAVEMTTRRSSRKGAKA